jgi:hypothetical protein
MVEMLLTVDKVVEHRLMENIDFEGLPTDEVFENFFNTVEKLAGVAYSEEEHLVNILCF